MALLRKQDPNSTSTAARLGEGGTVTVTLNPAQIKQRQDFAIQQNITTLRNRVDELGVTEPIVTRQGVDRIVVQLPGVQDPNEALRVLGATATLEFRLVDDQNDAAAGGAHQARAARLEALLLARRPARAAQARDDRLGRAAHRRQLGFLAGRARGHTSRSTRAARRRCWTRRARTSAGRWRSCSSRRSASPTDQPCNGVRSGTECTEEEVINVATIRGVFSSNFQITGVMANEARELALLLRAGSLAAPLYIVEQRTIGPSLGQDNVDRGFTALLVGLVGMFIFLAVYYRRFGLVANLVLLSNMVLLVALMSLLQASLSLPGIAGIVLTVGMAADANVLIFERIREELRNGMSPHAAINAGFDKAFSAIADSNITTLIAGIVLFTFGTGPVRGFAVTLCLGIVTSLFTAILCSRAYIHLIWGRQRKLASLPI